jgi:hypothetical protein
VFWSHRGRLRNEAAFAALAGVAPIPASSGRPTALVPGMNVTVKIHKIERIDLRFKPMYKAVA